jgi:propanol-preferring alcohol dehydrogenase
MLFLYLFVDHYPGHYSSFPAVKPLAARPYQRVRIKERISMKAAVLRKYDAPLVIQEVDIPAIGPREVLIRVRACGLCGTDLKIASGKLPKIPLPHIPGHEIAGEVHKIGEQVTEFRVDDRVAVHFYVTCGKCRNCRAGMDSLCENLKGQIGFHLDGGLAEFVKVPASNVLRIGDSISFPQAAILADAVATPYNALKRQAELRQDEVLVVVGAGGLGLHAIQIGKALGAKVIAVDVDDRHLEKAAELGAELTLHPPRDNIIEALREESGGGGADVVIDLVGRPETLERDLEWLRPAGKLLVVGYSPTQTFSVSSLQMVLKGLRIIGCRASTRRDLAEVISWVEEKKILPLVEDILPLAKVNEAYARLRLGQVISRLVIVP